MILLVNACQFVPQLLPTMEIIILEDASWIVQGNIISLWIITIVGVCPPVQHGFTLQHILLTCMLIIQHGHVFLYAQEVRIYITLSILPIHLFVSAC